MTLAIADAAFEQALAFHLDGAVPLAMRMAHLAELRHAQPELAGRLDQALLERDQAHAEAIEQLGAALGKLRETNHRLTAAPLREGCFLQKCELPDGRTLARVNTGDRGDALVEVLDAALLPTLGAGDRVLLTADGNAILAKSPSEPGAGECVAVERHLGSWRLLVRQRDQSVVMRLAASMQNQRIAEGDLVRIDPRSGFAMELIEPAATREFAASEEATSLPPESLAGCDDIRDDTLRRITYGVAHPDTAARYGVHRQRPWILLGGPPGLGKTTFARVAAGDLQRQTGRRCRIRKVNGAALQSSWVGESERRIRALVRELRESDEASILFIDEVEAVARTRGVPGNVHSDRFQSTWLAELEGFEGKAPFVLIAASNRLDMLDPAFRSRFATEIEMTRPNMDAARLIFAVHLSSALPYEGPPGGTGQVRTQLIEQAVARLYLPNAAGAGVAMLRLRDGSTREVRARDLVSGRLIEQICLDAKDRAFRRHVEGDPRGIGNGDMSEALDAAFDRMRALLTPFNAHDHLADIPRDLGVVAVDAAPRMRGSVAYLHTAA